MIMRRRIFLKSLASTIALASVASKKKPIPDLVFDHNLISVLLGPAFDGRAEFSIVHSQQQTMRYLIYKDDQFITEAGYQRVDLAYDKFKIDKFLLKNLPLATDLNLRIFAGYQLVDSRIFSSIPSNRQGYKIGLLSCMRAAEQEKLMWSSLEEQNSDLLLFLGDSIYADYNMENPVTPKVLWQKFVETRMVLQFYHWKRLVPVIALWDDHDFGGDNSGQNFPYVRESQQNFKNFFAQSLSEFGFISPGPGVACRFQLGNQLFLMLDGRSFREDPNSQKLYSFFGKEQEDWIFDSINNFQGLVWLCNGTQWFNLKGYGDSFRKEHKINFNMFIEKLNRANKSAIFASGDVHFSEVCQTPLFVKNTSLELTSSCMHSSNFIGLPSMSLSEFRVAATWRRNYIICRTAEANQKVLVDIQCFTKYKRLLFKTKTEFPLIRALHDINKEQDLSSS